MKHNPVKPVLLTMMNRPAFPPINITGLTLVLSCIMLTLLLAFNRPSTVRPGGEGPVTTTRGFHGKMCIGPDMMYALPKAETPVLLAFGLPASRILQRASACDPCTE